MGWSLRGAVAAVALVFCGLGCTDDPMATPDQSVVASAVTNRSGRLQFATGVFAGAEGAARLFGASRLDLTSISTTSDDLGMVRERFALSHNGLPVIGADLSVYTDATGTVVAAGGVEIPGSLAAQPSFADAGARAAALANTPGGASADEPELVYVAPSSGADVVLAWRSRVVGADGGLPIDEDVFVDATSGALIDRHPRIHTARNRLTYNANNQETTGTLARSEAQGATGDADVDAAHLAAGRTYDCLQALFGRDSYDGAGASLRSVANYGQNFENAFWDGQRMHYGDGFAVVDVGTHEFVHAVTETTANLVYQNQPGALNEAMSDIMAAACDARTRGQVATQTWTLGEDLPIGAIRFMDDPAKDKISRDSLANIYTGQEDNGGVHINSGIANLAFVLLVEGGTHPRGKTDVTVQGIGVEPAGRIAYRALTVYLQENSGFSAARAAWAKAAADLYDENAVYSVEEAWAAVGVGDAPVRPAPEPEPSKTSTGDGEAGPPNVTGGCNAANPDSAAWLLILGATLILYRRTRRMLPRRK